MSSTSSNNPPTNTTTSPTSEPNQAAGMSTPSSPTSLTSVSEQARYRGCEHLLVRTGPVPERDTLCPICHEDIEHEPTVQHIPCGQAFHQRCFDEHIEFCRQDYRQLTCPWCRAPISVSYQGHEDSASSSSSGSDEDGFYDYLDEIDEDVDYASMFPHNPRSNRQPEDLRPQTTESAGDDEFIYIPTNFPDEDLDGNEDHSIYFPTIFLDEDFDSDE